MNFIQYSSKDDFHASLDILAKYNTTDHEEIEFQKQDNNTFLPVATKLPSNFFWRFIRLIENYFFYRKEKSALKVIKFIQLNQGLTIGKSDVIDTIGKQILGSLKPSKYRFQIEQEWAALWHSVKFIDTEMDHTRAQARKEVEEASAAKSVTADKILKEGVVYALQKGEQSKRDKETRVAEANALKEKIKAETAALIQMRTDKIKAIRLKENEFREFHLQNQLFSLTGLMDEAERMKNKEKRDVNFSCSNGESLSFSCEILRDVCPGFLERHPTKKAAGGLDDEQPSEAISLNCFEKYSKTALMQVLEWATKSYEINERNRNFAYQKQKAHREFFEKIHGEYIGLLQLFDSLFQEGNSQKVEIDSLLTQLGALCCLPKKAPQSNEYERIELTQQWKENLSNLLTKLEGTTSQKDKIQQIRTLASKSDQVSLPIPKTVEASISSKEETAFEIHQIAQILGNQKIIDRIKVEFPKMIELIEILNRMISTTGLKIDSHAFNLINTVNVNPLFLEIRPEYIYQLAQTVDLIEDENVLFNNIMKWAEHQAKKQNITALEFIEKTGLQIFDGMNFKMIGLEHFQKVKSILSEYPRRFWEEYSLDPNGKVIFYAKRDVCRHYSPKPTIFHLRWKIKLDLDNPPERSLVSSCYEGTVRYSNICSFYNGHYGFSIERETSGPFKFKFHIGNLTYDSTKPHDTPQIRGIFHTNPNRSLAKIFLLPEQVRANSVNGEVEFRAELDFNN